MTLLVSDASLAHCSSLLTEYCSTWAQMQMRRHHVLCITVVLQPAIGAVMCRFGAQFKVPMPDMRARREILKLILSNHEQEMPYSVDPALLEVHLPELTYASSLARSWAALLCDTYA